MIKKLLLFLTTLLASLNTALAYNQDHPMFSIYPGANRAVALMTDYEKVSVPLSVVNSKKQPAYTALELIGDRYFHKYTVKNASTLKVYENYKVAAKKAGFTELFSCALENCGERRQVMDLTNLINFKGSLYHYENPYYWVGEKSTTKGKIVVAWYFGSTETTVMVLQLVVESEPAETNLIQVNASYTNPSGVTKAANLSAEEKAKDHALLPRYPGAQLHQYRRTDTESFTFIPAKNAENQSPIKLVGDLYKHSYEIQNTSTLKVYENYKEALRKGGFEFLSQCELAQCGSERDAEDLGRKLSIRDNIAASRHNPYYIVARKNTSNGNFYVGLFFGSFDTKVNVRQVILEEKAVQTGLVTVNADELKQQIDAEGKALIYGIYFDTGKAIIKPESKPTLDAIADLLKRNPSLLLYVVGHTDDTGSVASNLDLSKQRAKSVVDSLVSGYKIAASRLQAEGVGPYAPAANNTSDSGKQKNRRVELVKRLQ
jgi:outer membrane protein OmpA-like peptidoglycan-associated protein